jgi:hypothetical protein
VEAGAAARSASSSISSPRVNSDAQARRLCAASRRPQMTARADQRQPRPARRGRTAPKRSDLISESESRRREAPRRWPTAAQMRAAGGLVGSSASRRRAAACLGRERRSRSGSPASSWRGTKQAAWAAARSAVPRKRGW